MLARKTADAAHERLEANSPLIERMPSVRPASGIDAASASPVHALQARLAREVDASPRRSRFGVVRPLILLANCACWWGLIKVGVSVAHHWPFH